ncbi:hypothetical protein CHELA1G11_21903 [Hyphomicrobiales bacterium]|nr:hypothetical protein CHELA1G2_20167 [Hyphomicrobiales bacterium]CAH1695534.1 hypothetical protein CHELA1G11_21903 [Hyphomicrobiales bacterium]
MSRLSRSPHRWPTVLRPVALRYRQGGDSHMQSIKSTALEPTIVELEQMSLGQKIKRLIPVYGLLIFTLLMIVVFSILLPNTFPTMLNLRSILGDKAIIAILSLAAMIPMAAGRIDLTVGYGIVLWHILAIALQTRLGLPWPGACWDCSTASWSRLRASIPLLRRSARALCSMRSPSGTRRVARSSGCCPRVSRASIPGSLSAFLLSRSTF